jgi:hypothetical protein
MAVHFCAQRLSMLQHCALTAPRMDTFSYQDHQMVSKAAGHIISYIVLICAQKGTKWKLKVWQCTEGVLCSTTDDLCCLGRLTSHVAGICGRLPQDYEV